MPSQRQGLTTQDKPLSGESGVLTAIVADLAKLEFGTYVTAAVAPLVPADGLVWFNPDDDSFQFWSDSAADWIPFSTGGDVTAHILSNPATHADGSMRTAHLADLNVTSAKLAAGAVTAGKIGVGGVSAANQLAAGVADDAAIGSRTAVDTTGSPSLTGGLLAQLSSIWTTIKAIKGTAGALTAPPTTLLAAKAHADANAPHSGHQTPAGSQAQVDAHNAAQGAHGLYSGSGTPEAVVTAPVGSVYRDTTNGALYIKRTGSGNTGWQGVGMGTTIGRLSRSTNVAPVSAGVAQTITWDTVESDSGGFWSGGTPTRLTAPVDGIYRIGIYALQDNTSGGGGFITAKRWNIGGGGGFLLFDAQVRVLAGGKDVDLIWDEQPVYLTAGQYITFEYTPKSSSRGLHVATSDGGTKGILAWMSGN